MRWWRSAVLLAAVSALLGACGTPRNGALSLPEAADRTPPLAEQGPRPVDEPGALHYDNPRLDKGAGPQPGEETDPPQRPQREPSPRPATGPARGDGNATEPGRYMTIGSVIVEVGGAPVYADKVVRELEDVLAAEAKRRDSDSFRTFAAAEIRRHIDEVAIPSEIYFAEAVKNLTPQEQQQAEMLATKYHQSLISDAGGSVEVAKSRAAAEGWDLDERVRDRYRKLMVDLYLYKRVFPRVTIKPQDIRRYYDRNIDSAEITQPEQLHFRVIRIDHARAGSREEARAKIEELRRRVQAGEEFAEIARAFSHDYSAGIGGDVGWVNRDAYVHDEVEEAVAQLQPGQITEVIESGQALFLAKLEGRRPRQVKPFSDPSVQKGIRDALHAQQVDAISRRALQRLMQDAIISPANYSIEPALELAMQRYPQWQAEGK